MNNGYTGTVGGITFADGVAVGADDMPHLADASGRVAALKGYFRRHGLRTDDDNRVVRDDTVTPDAPVDSRLLGVEKVGAPLRDAAVDPRSEDFLVPTNAGEADPHGPEVVSPGLHANQDVRPVRPGDVDEESPDVQEIAETAHAAEAVELSSDAPRGNAGRPAWKAYAESLELVVTDEMSRDDIRQLVTDAEAAKAAAQG